mmetsp:Transcript_30718/g.57527  ORF Transcript_30718/g.57527 Transcript_30718/m.57527 type:complete len:655 (+) Transcript_30718:61-2025(+)
MKCLVITLVLAGLAVSHASDVTPVGKVVEMLKDMKAQGEKDKQEEEVQYAAYKQFCAVTEAEKGRDMQKSTEKIEVLDAEIEKSESDATRLGEEIAAHIADVEGAGAEKEEAASIRETERATFQSMFQDYVESIDAIGRALKELKSRQVKDGSLIQLTSLKLPEKASKGLNALLSQGFEDSLVQDLQAPPYQFQSGGVVTMLEKLQDQFADERLQLEKEETAKKHAYELLMQSVTTKIAEAKKEQQQKEMFKAKKMQDKASAAGDMAETKAGLDVDKTYLEDLTTTCRKKAADFEERQKLRGEELVALSEAIKAMTEISSASFLQAKPAKPTALAQMRSDGATPAQAQVARFLQKEAGQLNSRLLSALAERARGDPVTKVADMIKQLIVRLKDQANEETTKKAWCDSELSTNKATREEKSDAVSNLQAEMDELEAHIGKLGEEVTELSTELTELEAAMAEATKLRQEETTKNEATVKEAKEGQQAVAKAVMVLKDFYSKAGQTALLQSSKQLQGAPPVFGDEPYQGMQNAKGGVVAMLEVIESDFSRMEAEATAGEASGKKDYEAFMEEAKITKAEKTKEVEHKTSFEKEKKSELITLQADMQGTQKELEAAEVYFEKLKPDCLDAGVSYEERKARREQEMKDLEEALEMLDAV